MDNEIDAGMWTLAASDRIVLPPLPFRAFCPCSLRPSANGCMKRPRARSRRMRLRRDRGERDDGGGDDDGGGGGGGGGGDPPPSRGDADAGGGR